MRMVVINPRDAPAASGNRAMQRASHKSAITHTTLPPGLEFAELLLPEQKGSDMITLRTHIARAVAMTALTAVGLAAPAAAKDDPSSVQTLMSNLPKGYTASDCQQFTVMDNYPATAGVSCNANHDPDGPAATSFYLFDNPARLEAQFKYDVKNATVQAFPDGMAGPGRWNNGSVALTIPPDNPGLTLLEWTTDTPRILALATPQGDVNNLYTNWFIAEVAS
jgi:hypothetical protein